MNRFGIAKLEQGVREPSWATVQALARALGLDCLAFTADAPGASAVEQQTPAGRRRPGRPRKKAPPASPTPAKGRTRGKTKGK
jgi:hypothetical protein